MGIGEQILCAAIVALFQIKLKINPLTNIFIIAIGAILGNYLTVIISIILILTYRKG